jgi:hypothetical protein
MRYVLSGKVRGQLAPGIFEPIAHTTVRIYRLAEGMTAGLEARQRTVVPLTYEAIQTKEYRWMTHTPTDAEGAFSIDLREQTIFGGRGTTHVYAGEPIEIDLYCRTLPGQSPGEATEHVQFSLAQVQPDWREGADGFTADLDLLTASHEVWREVRTAMGGWVVFGRVANQMTRSPVAGLRVYAFDADLLQDDPLGVGTTDAEGRFRIDFLPDHFRDTPIPGISVEQKGPDVYFRIEGPDGRILIAENRTRARRPDRRNIENLYEAELFVDGEAQG